LDRWIVRGGDVPGGTAIGVDRTDLAGVAHSALWWGGTDRLLGYGPGGVTRAEPGLRDRHRDSGQARGADAVKPPRQYAPTNRKSMALLSLTVR